MQRKKQVKKKAKESKSAHVLIIIAIILSLLFSLFYLLSPNLIIKTFRESFGPSSAPTQQIVITLGIIGIIASCLVGLSHYNIRKTKDKSWMWFLIALGLILTFSISIVAGLLILTAGILFLRKENKKK